MSYQIVAVLILTAVIHLVGTLSYSVRLVGARTGRIAVSFALFNVLVLLTRTSNTLQAPLLAKHVEGNIAAGLLAGDTPTFRLILLAATAGTILGGVLIPTFQGLFVRTVRAFDVHRSVPRLLLHGVMKIGVRHLRDAARLPSRENVETLRQRPVVPLRLLALNTAAAAVMTVGVLASMYAGYLSPELRVTCNSLSAVINGCATVALVLIVDPYLSMLTDDVVAGSVSQVFFRKAVTWVVLTKLAGTLVAQLLLLPAARLIAAIAALV